MNQKILDKLTRARAGLIIDQPFFGALALRLHLIERTDIKTLAVDGRNVFYNPEFVDGLDMLLVKAALAHEVGHCIFDHIARRSGRDATKWNHAGDYIINEVIEAAGFTLGENWLRNKAFDGMTADQVYSMLPDNPAGDALDEMQDGDSGIPGEQPLTPAEQRDWKIATIQAANAAKAQGKLPDSLERFIDGFTKSKVDWKTVLRRFINQRNDADYTWSRLNRRMLAHDIYLPSLYSECMGDIVIAIDTSGSIDQPTLECFGGELDGIIGETKPANVHVIYCDAQVNKVVSFKPEDPFKLEAVGGGGTAFEPVAQYVEKHDLRPVCLVYLTDLYGPTNFPPPDYPWLWCTIGTEAATFGEVLKIEV